MKYVKLVMNYPLFLLFDGRFALPGKEPRFRVDKRYWEAAPSAMVVVSKVVEAFMRPRFGQRSWVRCRCKSTHYYHLYNSGALKNNMVHFGGLELHAEGEVPNIETI